MWLVQRLRSTPDPEAAKALADARKSLRETKARNSEVQAVASSLRLMRERNHFAEKLSIIMAGGLKL